MIKPFYEEDNITIYCADALDVLPDLSGLGAIVTDPPYSSGGAFRGDRARSTSSKYVNSDAAAYRPEFAGDTRDQRAFSVWCSMWMNAARYASAPGAAMLSFIDWRQVSALADAVQVGGWIYRGLATWWKPGIRMQRGRFSSSAEFVVYATNGEVIDHAGAPQNVFKCAPERDKEHIAEKPEAVVDWCLSAVAPGVTVCDPFMGSGTTLVVAKRRGHPCIGVEVDAGACEIAVRRLAQNVLPL